MSHALVVRYSIQFKEAMKVGLDGLIKAAEVYVKLIDEHPELEDSFKQECKGFVPDGVWTKMEKVGRGRLHPRLMIGSFNSLAKSQAVARLPIEIQESALRGESFDILVDGQPVKSAIEDAPVDAVNRLCCSGGIRTVAQQRALAAAERADRKTVESSWRLVDGGRGVQFTRRDTFTKKQLEKIIERMEG